MMRNPYCNRGPITEIDDFYGRKGEIVKIYSRIAADHPQSIAVVGEPKIGKSSLLRFLYNEENKRAYLSDPDDYIYLFFELRPEEHSSPDIFFRSLSGLVHKAAGSILGFEMEPSYDGFKKAVETLKERGKKLIIFFDDFNVITQGKDFPVEFFSFLRSIANNYDVAYITSSHLELQKLSASKAIVESPFFNIFTNVPLRPFKREEVIQLIEEPSQRAGVPFKGHTDFIIDIAGLFPYLVQIACGALFEIRAHKPQIDSSDLETAKAKFLKEAKDFYESIWSGFDQDQKNVCGIIVVSKRIKRQAEHIARDLVRRGYLLEEKGKYEFFSSTFKDFVREKCGAELTGPEQNRGLFSRLGSVFRR